MSLHSHSCRRLLITKMTTFSFHLLLLLLFAMMIDDALSGGGEKQLHQQQQPIDVIQYTIWDASKFPVVLKEWEDTYPDLIRVTTSQDAYGLPTAGTSSDCPFYTKSPGCPNYFFTLQDYTAHPVGSKSSSHLPEVFLSGCLHGDERVGPTSVMEATALLLEAAHCEGLPRRTGSSSELEEAKQCRRILQRKGIDDVHRKWLARLVNTRRIVVAPTANGTCLVD